MKLLILITSDPFVQSIEDGHGQGKKLINYWTNGVLPEGEFDRVDIFNGDKLVVSGKKKSMTILPLEESYNTYHPTCGGMLPSVDALRDMLARVFGEVPDPIGNIVIEDYDFDPKGLPCTYPHRSTEKFTFVTI